MSTRSTTWFIDGDVEKPAAKIYRHSDGYPEGHGVDLQKFFADVETQAQDTRFGDPTYLAAKLIVWLARLFAPYSAPYELGDGVDAETRDERRLAYADEHPLNFISVGVITEDPGDIEFVYVVDCSTPDDKGRPTVTCHERGGGWDDPVTLGDVVEIPVTAEAV